MCVCVKARREMAGGHSSSWSTLVVSDALRIFSVKERSTLIRVWMCTVQDRQCLFAVLVFACGAPAVQDRFSLCESLVSRRTPRERHWSRGNRWRGVLPSVSPIPLSSVHAFRVDVFACFSLFSRLLLSAVHHSRTSTIDLCKSQTSATWQAG